MKRTLFEVLVGLAVIVVMVSFHSQIDRLRNDNDEIVRLQRLVEDTVAKAGSKSEIANSRVQILNQVTAKLEALQTQLADAQRDAKNAAYLKDEIVATRQEASLLRAELTRDVQRTKQLVDTYQTELRREAENTRSSIDAARQRVDELAGVVRPDHKVLYDELLAPTVQLNGDDTVGSGTLIRSSRDARTGKVKNYVITSYHVVRNIMADTPRSRTDGIEVTIYVGDRRETLRGKMISHDAGIDAAMLELEGKVQFDNVARVLPRDRVAQVDVWDSVYALGCPLGNDPIPTTGELSSKHNVLNGSNYWMINAPTYYGNSGGGVYLADGHYLIGVFSKIYTHGKGNPVVVPHMGLCTPITLIYDWLDRENLGHVIPQHSSLAVAAKPGK